MSDHANIDSKQIEEVYNLIVRDLQEGMLKDVNGAPVVAPTIRDWELVSSLLRGSESDGFEYLFEFNSTERDTARVRVDARALFKLAQTSHEPRSGLKSHVAAYAVVLLKERLESRGVRGDEEVGLP